IETQKSFALQKAGFQPNLVWAHLTTALGAPHGWPFWLWIGVILFVAVAGATTLATPMKHQANGTDDLAVFAFVAMTFGIGGFYLFIRVAEMPTEPWYFLPPMVFVVAAAEGPLGSWLRRLRL